MDGFLSETARDVLVVFGSLVATVNLFVLLHSILRRRRARKGGEVSIDRPTLDKHHISVRSLREDVMNHSAVALGSIFLTLPLIWGIHKASGIVVNILGGMAGLLIVLELAFLPMSVGELGAWVRKRFGDEAATNYWGICIGGGFLLALASLAFLGFNPPLVPWLHNFLSIQSPCMIVSALSIIIIAWVDAQTAIIDRRREGYYED